MRPRLPDSLEVLRGREFRLFIAAIAAVLCVPGVWREESRRS